MLFPVPLPPGIPRPVRHQESPENLEYPLSHLNGWLTPSTRFFRRNHFAYPALDPAGWRLTVGGEVNTPTTFTLPQLQALPQTSIWATLVCSGNKRSLMEPPPEGTPWRSGAVGNAEWGGVLLRDLLRAARPGPEAREVLFVGADRGIFKETGEEVAYARSLPLTEALGGGAGAGAPTGAPRPGDAPPGGPTAGGPPVSATTVGAPPGRRGPDSPLLALTMNGQPLPREHGGPVRLVVPHWYGMASVKWVTHIELLARPFRGPFQAKDYVYLPAPGAYDRASPVTLQKVDSVITHPAPGQRFKPGRVPLRGVAWGGSSPLARVEVSLDNGATWAVAELVGPEAPAAWRLWQYLTPSLPPGRHEVTVRATNADGEVQPATAPWNAKGYGNNAIPRVQFLVSLLANRG